MNDNEQFRITAARDPWSKLVDIRIGYMRAGRWHVVQPVTLQILNEPEFVPPAMTLEPALAQQLMDELWLCGIRPTEGAGSAGSLAATERHLADMRRIALEALEMTNVIRKPQVV